jgi:guanine deaminase
MSFRVEAMAVSGHNPHSLFSVGVVLAQLPGNSTQHGATTKVVIHRAAELWHATGTGGADPQSTTARRGRLGARFRFQAVSDAGLAVDSSTGRIVDCGNYREVKSRYPQSIDVNHGEGVILPGFVDAHLHFPQLDVIGSHGKHLIQWLESYIFPAESRFADAQVATGTASRLTRELARNGVTTSVVFSSVHPVAAEVLFTAFVKSGLRAVVGKTSMDINAPSGVLLDWKPDIDAQEELIARWHGRDGRLFYAVTPRFVLTSSLDQMRALSELHARHPGTYIQTHISECEGELKSVAEAFPSAKDYLSIYEDHGLINDRTLLGHGVWLSDSERERVASLGATVVHCPTSNAFLGSGLIDLKKTCDAGVEVALGSDIGAGTSLSPWVTMLEAYKIQALRSQPLEPEALLYLATLAGAEALHMDRDTGSLESGKFADFQVVRFSRKPILAERIAGAKDARERLFATVVHGDDRILDKLYVAGRCVQDASHGG